MTDVVVVRPDDFGPDGCLKRTRPELERFHGDGASLRPRPLGRTPAGDKGKDRDAGRDQEPGLPQRLPPSHCWDPVVGTETPRGRMNHPFGNLAT